MHKACAIDLRGFWDESFLLLEFTYNNNYQTNIKMASFKVLFERKNRSHICSDDIRDKNQHLVA